MGDQNSLGMAVRSLVALTPPNMKPPAPPPLPMTGAHVERLPPIQVIVPHSAELMPEEMARLIHGRASPPRPHGIGVGQLLTEPATAQHPGQQLRTALHGQSPSPTGIPALVKVPSNPALPPSPRLRIAAHGGAPQLACQQTTFSRGVPLTGSPQMYINMLPLPHQRSSHSTLLLLKQHVLTHSSCSQTIPLTATIAEVADIVARAMERLDPSLSCEWVTANHVSGAVYTTISHDLLQQWGIASHGVRVTLLQLRPSLVAGVVSGTAMRETMTVSLSLPHSPHSSSFSTHRNCGLVSVEIGSGRVPHRP
jgi:hypothetical protein